MKRIAATAALLASLAAPLSSQTDVTVRLEKGKIASVENNFEQPYGTYYILNKPGNWLYPSDFGDLKRDSEEILHLDLYCSSKDNKYAYPFFSSDFRREMRGRPEVEEPDVWLGVSAVNGNVVLAKVDRQSKRFKELHEKLMERAYMFERMPDLRYSLPCP